MSSISVWGVDHGVEIAKSKRNLSGAEKTAAGIAGAVNGPLPGTGGAIAGAVMGRKGRKTAVAARTGGRSFGEAVLGATAGNVLTRGNLRAAQLGALAGGAHGGIAAMNNAARRGDLKPRRSY